MAVFRYFSSETPVIQNWSASLSSMKVTELQQSILINESMLERSSFGKRSCLPFSRFLFSLWICWSSSNPLCSSITIPCCVNKPNAWQVAAFIWQLKGCQRRRVICLCAVSLQHAADWQGSHKTDVFTWKISLVWFTVGGYAVYLSNMLPGLGFTQLQRAGDWNIHQ